MNHVNISAIIRDMKIRERKDERVEGRITVGNSRKSFYGKTKTEVKKG